MDSKRGIRKWIRSGIAILLIVFGSYGLLAPGVTATWFIATDRGLKENEPSRFAIHFHRKFCDHYANYARERIVSKDAANLSIFEIAETEWPLFGSVFFLWATEQLQSDYEENPEWFSAEPKQYAKNAIEAATDLVLDPTHATWVREHWKEDYLTRENCFYRMLEPWLHR
ncbi:MAG: hypothetical protein ACI9R3_003966 [Verrucomicrobiales bacterium]|jgi:hypothetical protein